MMLIRTYRVRGHLAANLDPLGLTQRELPADLTPAYHGFSGADLDRKIYLGGTLGFEQASIREILPVLQANYCGTVGLEYMHINDLEERRFLQDRMEGKDAAIQLHARRASSSILDKVIHGEQWEKFLAKKYVGTKRFGLDGGESAIPALEAVIKYGGQYGRRGDRHRHGPPRPAERPLQRDGQALSRHLPRIRRRRDQPGRRRRIGRRQISPRHLDRPRVRRQQGASVAAAQPVAPRGGRPGRARQGPRRRRPCKGDEEGDTVLPVLLHGDAAFAGQGIVAECFGFSGPARLRAPAARSISSSTTRSASPPRPQFARSSPYPSDVAKSVQAPILHVNGDDPEAVTFACKLAIEFRQAFNRDIVIDMWCYRRFGHNEGDEPSFTQPLMYEAIRKHPPVSQIYGQRLIAEGVIDQKWIDETTANFIQHLESEFEAGSSYLPNKADWFAGRWAGLGMPGEPVDARRNVNTAIAEDQYASLSQLLTTVPEGLTIHKTLGRILEAKKKTLDEGQGIDWATAEALAFGSLVEEGYRVRLSGQDSGRGTFSQRHAVWVDQKSGEKYIPLSTIEQAGRPLFEVLRQPAVRIRRARLRIWLFAWPTRARWCCGRRSSAISPMARRRSSTSSSPRAKPSGCARRGWCMLLPHGFEGQGPEHSSARLERYLQLCAEDNIQVANCTTPANYFHILRRQMLRDFRKPLVHDDAQVAAAAQAGGVEARRFHRRRPFPPHPERPQSAGGGRDATRRAVLGQARL